MSAGRLSLSLRGLDGGFHSRSPCDGRARAGPEQESGIKARPHARPSSATTDATREEEGRAATTAHRGRACDTMTEALSLGLFLVVVRRRSEASLPPGGFVGGDVARSGRTAVPDAIAVGPSKPTAQLALSRDCGLLGATLAGEASGQGHASDKQRVDRAGFRMARGSLAGGRCLATTSDLRVASAPGAMVSAAHEARRRSRSPNA